MNTNYTPAELMAWIAPIYRLRSNNPNVKLTLLPYAYPVTFSALTQGSTQNAQALISANADFVVLGVNHRAQIGAAQTVSTKTAPFVRMLVVDTGSNLQWTQSAVDLETFSTNGIGVQNLPFPRILGGRTSLSITVTNYAPTAETYTTLDVVFSGVQVYVMD